MTRLNKKKGTCSLEDLALPIYHREESEKIYSGLVRKFKKNLRNIRVSQIPIVVGVPRTAPKDTKNILEKKSERKNRDHLNYNNVEIGQNTEKSPGNLLLFKLRGKLTN